MNWSTWEPQERAVIAFLRDGDRLLLIRKKRGLGAGKVNGPGGHVEPGETREQAALREVEEETGLRPRSLQQAAELAFQFVQGLRLHLTVFLGVEWDGTLRACDEAEPFWQSEGQIPWRQLWADDALWLPPVLAGRSVTGRFLFDHDSLVEAEIRIAQRPPVPLNG